ncbi:MAG: nitric oxide reductase activation protein NorD, partial [Candidatus Tectimicrobiota bacterium]
MTSVPIPIALQPVYDSLAPISVALARRYIDVAARLQPLLSAPAFGLWTEHCVQLARSGWRAWESADAFLQQSPFLQQHLALQDLWLWAEHGKALSHLSAEVAAAFFHAARPFLQGVSQALFPTWVAGCRPYLEASPPLLSLAAEYFRLSPQIYSHYAPDVATLWSQVGAAYARVSPQHGQTFFVLSRAHLDHSPLVDHTAAWEWLGAVLPRAAPVTLAYLERYADLCQRFGPDSTRTIADLLLALVPSSAAEAQTLLRLVHSTLGFLPAPERLQALAWCQHILAVCPAAVQAFLQHFAPLQRRLPGERLQPWIDSGLDIARHNRQAGEAYFALESATALERLQALQRLVAFRHVAPVLRLYTQAMLGRPMALRTTAELPPGFQSAGRDLPTSDGTAIFVPEQVSDFDTEPDNFAAYKVAILHQAGYYECGTLTFSLAECCQRLPDLCASLALTNAAPPAAEALSLFLNAFPEPALARSLFTVLEDARIDASIARRYKGMQRALALVMASSLRQRPSLPDLPLRQALLEGLLQCTLGLDLAAADAVPPLLRLLLQRLWQRLTPLHAAAATVYDTVAAVFDCYLLIVQIPRSALSRASLEAVVSLESLLEQLPDDADSLLLADMFRQAGAEAESTAMLPESDAPASGMEPVPYRGEAKPELLQKSMRLQELAEQLAALEQPVNALPPEVLKQLLEQGDIEIKSVQAGDLNETSGLFVTNLEGREGLLSAAAEQRARLQQDVERLQAELQQAYGGLEAQRQTFLYDEWDYLIGDYRRAWCRVTETILQDAGTAFVDETLQRHAELGAQIARQLQLLKPETFTPRKRLMDGEEIDLDSAIEALVDRRASHTLPEKVYMRRQRRERSVAALFLLDMSASTDEVVKEPDTLPTSPTPAPPPRLYDFSGFIQEEPSDLLAPRRPVPQQSGRRIIDLEKEALVLMAEALADLGDAYAVYGFSGYGRDQVECFVVKAFAEPYEARVQGRIGAITPQRSTRMGPAIRHAVTKLERQEARLKLLLLLSDGYPQDFDYGKDRKSKDYGIEDTAMALHETRLLGIQTCCITVDPA